MNGFLRVGALALIGIAAVVFYVATFVVQQTQSAIVLRFGAVRSVVTAPGLYFKLPAPFEQVVYLDNRILDLDLPAQEIIASDQKRLVVDASRATGSPIRCASTRRSTTSRGRIRSWLRSSTVTSVRFSPRRPSPRWSAMTARG
jgi:membrane protease subunit HflC